MVTSKAYKNILILGAMECEIAPLKDRADLHIIKTGVGMKKVHKCIRKKITPFLAHQSIDLAINIGFAGSVNNNIKKFTLVVPERLTLQAQKETLHIDLKKWVDFFNKAHSLNEGKYHVGGHLLCVDRILNRDDKKKLTIKENNFDYIDMESYWLGRFMQQKGIPFIVIRCILDEYNFHLPPLKFLSGKWPLRLWKEALSYFPLHPRELINLLLLCTYEKKAANENTKALLLFLNSIEN